MSDTGLTVRVLDSAGALAAAEWDACARGEADRPDPFLSHAFFDALERSGSATRLTGWAPHHLLVETGTGSPVGLMPCYLKSHSRGEYVFDQGWADALERAGGRYYPKLQASVPFTPATGPRLLVRHGPDADPVRRLLIEAGMAITGQRGVSSLHVTFCPRDEWDAFGAAGYLQRTDTQFHWLNEGYASFADFTAALSSRKRKLINRERRDALSANGISIHHLTGSDLTEGVWDAFFAFYQDTGSRKWGRPYLTRSFFSMIGASMADRILLIMARRENRWIAGAINFLGTTTLYGRHWGATEHHPFLHFEVCYYQAIDHAIANGLAVVEAGAQGEHKLARGYRPVTTYSAHHIANPSFRRAIDDYLRRERAYVAEVGAELAALTPFRKTAGGGSDPMNDD